MYGSAEDSEAKLQLEQTRPLVDISAEKLSEASKRFGETLRNLQGCRLAWENILHMLEGAAERGPASGKQHSMHACTQHAHPPFLFLLSSLTPKSHRHTHTHRQVEGDEPDQ